jgi:hypothetical protein
VWKTIAPIPTGIGWFVAIAALALPAASAEEPNRKDENAVVRVIALGGFGRVETNGVAWKPTRITNSEELAKAFPDGGEQWLDGIAKQVDFEKEELLLFSWTGSTTDSLSFKVEQTKRGPVAVFRYKRGWGEDLPKPRLRLYAIAKNWRVEGTK